MTEVWVVTKKRDRRGDAGRVLCVFETNQKATNASYGDANAEIHVGYMEQDVTPVSEEERKKNKGRTSTWADKKTGEQITMTFENICCRDESPQYTIFVPSLSFAFHYNFK